MVKIGVHGSDPILTPLMSGSRFHIHRHTVNRAICRQTKGSQAVKTKAYSVTQSDATRSHDDGRDFGMSWRRECN